MAAWLHTLALLQDELPDPDQDLYFQRFPTATFHLFPKLPGELRLKIWHHTVPQTRCITIFVKDRRRGVFGSGPKLDPSQHLGLIRFPVPPITYCINRESRYETLKQYEYLNPQASRIPAELDWIGIAGSSGGFISRYREENILQGDVYDIIRYPFYGEFLRAYFGDRANDFFAGIGIAEMGVGNWWYHYTTPTIRGLHHNLKGLSEIRLIDDKSGGRFRIDPDTIYFSEEEAQKCITHMVRHWYSPEPAREMAPIVISTRVTPY